MNASTLPGCAEAKGGRTDRCRIIAKQAEAERLRRAKVINAEGEQQAAEKLVEAGRLLAREPQAIRRCSYAIS
jgi:hypothetical protein